MKSMFLVTTELSERLFKFIYPKMDKGESVLFSKFDDIESFEKPDVIVTACSHVERDKDIIKKFGSRSVFVVEGLNNWRYVKGDYVDKVAVWGENMKKDFIRGGWDTEKLFITGCPRFENHKRRVLIALPFYTKEELDNEKFTQDISTILRDKNIIVNVKRHPGISDEKSDIIESIRECDVVITGASTIALHAALMDKRVVYFDAGTRLFNREQHFKPLVDKGIKICYNYEQIVEQFEYPEHLKNYLYHSSSAAQNIIDLIRSLY